jgi:hypothetical protein
MHLFNKIPSSFLVSGQTGEYNKNTGGRSVVQTTNRMKEIRPHAAQTPANRRSADLGIIKCGKLGPKKGNKSRIQVATD